MPNNEGERRSISISAEKYEAGVTAFTATMAVDVLNILITEGKLRVLDVHEAAGKSMHRVRTSEEMKELTKYVTSKRGRNRVGYEVSSLSSKQDDEGLVQNLFAGYALHNIMTAVNVVELDRRGAKQS